MTKNIIEEIIETLSQVEGLRYIAEDWGQLDYEQPPVQWPCALIDMQDIQYSQTGMGGLLANCTFTIQLADRAMLRVSSRAPEDQKHRTLQIFYLIDSLFLFLHAKESEYCSPFILKSMQRVHQPEIQAYLLTFTTQFRLNKPQRTAPLNDINVRINRK